MTKTTPNWQPIPGTTLEQNLNDPEQEPLRNPVIRQRQPDISYVVLYRRKIYGPFRSVEIAFQYAQAGEWTGYELGELIAP